MCTPHRPLVVTKQFLRNLYDALYKEGQRLLDEFQPCNIKPVKKFVHRPWGPNPEPSKKKWQLMKCDGYSEPGWCCCSGCSHLEREGCKVKALFCKLWLCSRVDKKYPKLEKAFIKLRRIGRRHNLLYWRGSKKYSLKMAFEYLARR